MNVPVTAKILDVKKRTYTKGDKVGQEYHVVDAYSDGEMISAVLPEAYVMKAEEYKENGLQATLNCSINLQRGWISIKSLM